MNLAHADQVIWLWTTILLHFVWQGTLVAAVLAILLRRLPPAASTKRYWLLLAGLACMILMPIATGGFLWGARRSGPHSLATVQPNLPTPAPESGHAAGELRDLAQGTLVFAADGGLSNVRRFSDSAVVPSRIVTERNLRLAAFAVWLAMQILLGGRLLIGGLWVWRVRRLATEASENVLATSARLARRFGLRRVPMVQASDRIGDAATVGFLRGSVILPAAWLANMSPEMLEAVLAHEFAHLRRHDQWVNLCQRIVETVFFYHPAVWWLSGQIRLEREHCCDACAVAVTADAGTFARALERAAHQRTGMEFGLTTNFGGKQMSLLNRVERVLGEPPTGQRGARWPVAALTMLLPMMLLLPGESTPTMAADPPEERAPQFDAADDSPPAPVPVSGPSRKSDVPNAQAHTKPPSEFAKTALPNYVIEPPDVLLIKDVKLTPKSNATIACMDLLSILVKGTSDESSICGEFRVNEDGRVDLGPGYGHVRVSGKTVEEAAEEIELALSPRLQSVEVTVSLLAPADAKFVSGEHLVAPDGTVNLGLYGRVFVAGATLPEARHKIEQRLAKDFEDPTVVVDVFMYNSKCCYVVVESHDKGKSSVHRIPQSGNETVLDALALVGEMNFSSVRHIWIARPLNGRNQILPVDWEAITRGGDTTTNYQLLRGDRLFISNRGPGESGPNIVQEFNRLVASRQLNAAIKLAFEADESSDPAIETIKMHATLLRENLDHRAQLDAEATASYIQQLKRATIRETILKRDLEEMVQVDYQKVPLHRVIRNLSEQAGVDIMLDESGLITEGLTADVPVTLHLKEKISLQNALRIVLSPHRLAAGIHSGVVRVTSQQRVESCMLRTYAVGDLVELEVVEEKTKVAESLGYDALVELITACIAPQSWSGLGGPGAIRAHAPSKTLVVNNTPSVHQQIQSLLEKLAARRRAAAGAAKSPRLAPSSLSF